jgi:hypothetical protein
MQFFCLHCKPCLKYTVAPTICQNNNLAEKVPNYGGAEGRERTTEDGRKRGRKRIKNQKNRVFERNFENWDGW